MKIVPVNMESLFVAIQDKGVALSSIAKLITVQTRNIGLLNFSHRPRPNIKI